MKSYNHEKIDILNYVLIKNWKNPIFRNYKLQIKSIWCNAKCFICDDWKINWNIKAIKKNLNIVFKEILKENIKYKTIQILWWEPLLIFDELIKIIKIWNNYWIKFDFPTNASLLNISKIDKLINFWLDNFTFSIDFPDNYHNNWRILTWSFEKIIEFTKYLKEKWIKIQWNTVIWKFNCNQIEKFSELYKLIYPDIHNFILIEENWWISKENFLNKIELEKINVVLYYLEKTFLNIKITKNWFDKNLNKNNNKLCFVPIKTITYKIEENWYKINPCYFDTNKNIDNIWNFINNAITNWCNLCESSYKNNYNNYFLEIIKKYKLSNK